MPLDVKRMSKQATIAAAKRFALVLSAILFAACADGATAPEVMPRPVASLMNCDTREWEYDPWTRSWTEAASGETVYSDPYASCNGGFGDDWGNDYGDGGGFNYWNEVAPPGIDMYGVAANEEANCPRCVQVVGDLANKLAQNPAVQQAAAQAGQSASAYAARLANAWQNIGPRVTGQWHHIATDKNWISTLRGGPWSPQFEQLFKQGGMNLNNAANRVFVVGHVGPHPELYHSTVMSRLQAAVHGLSGKRAEEALRQALAEIAEEVARPGSYLNDLITRR